MQKVRKTAVESIGRGAVGYRVEGTRIKRIWHKPGIIRQIPVEELSELVVSPGGERLLTQHLLIADQTVREELGLPIKETLMMNDEKMKNLLQTSVANLKKVVPEMYPENVKRLAELAVEIEVDSLPKINYLKEKSGIDVYKQIQFKKEAQDAKNKK